MQQSPVLIVGLGNIGDEYSCTRHNVGFCVVDMLAELFSESFSLKKQAFVLQATKSNRSLIVAKPNGYMNNSGIAVASLCSWYKIPAHNCLVITDNVDLPSKKIRFKPAKKNTKDTLNKTYQGTHNGIKSLVQQLGTSNFMRLYLGVGSERESNTDLAKYVLQKLPAKRWQVYHDMCECAAQALYQCDDFESLATVLQSLQKDDTIKD